VGALEITRRARIFAKSLGKLSEIGYSIHALWPRGRLGHSQGQNALPFGKGTRLMTLLSIHPPSPPDQRTITERTRGIRGLHVVLLKPSKYDDAGYVLRHWRGVLPSNTLACLYALTEDVKQRRALREDLELTSELLDEAVHKINVAKIIRRSRRPGWKTVVCLVGVQTNQYPRAVDLARAFRAAGMDVIIGGFHVSGTLALFHNPTPAIQELLDLVLTLSTRELQA